MAIEKVSDYRKIATVYNLKIKKSQQNHLYQISSAAQVVLAKRSKWVLVTLSVWDFFKSANCFKTVRFLYRSGRFKKAPGVARGIGAGNPLCIVLFQK